MNIFDMAMMNKMITAAEVFNSRASPLNLLAGLTPTVSQWTTNYGNGAGTPCSNPQNITDGDPTTFTGIGTKKPFAIEDICYYDFDLGSIKTFLPGFQITAWCATAIPISVDFFIKRSSGDAWTQPVIWQTGNLTLAAAPISEQALPLANTYGTVTTARYLRLRVKVGGSSTGNLSLRIFEIFAHEMKLAATG